MKTSVEIVTAPCADASGTTVLLHFDDKRYLFGHVAEGTQRLFIESNVKMVKVSDIFLTGKTEWRTTGGLVGLILTLADVQIARRKALNEALEAKQKPHFQKHDTSVTVHGGKNLLNTIASTRNFVFRQDMSMNINEFNFKNGQPKFSDANISVYPVRTFPRKGTNKKQTLEEAKLDRLEDVDLNSRAALEGIVKSMFNSTKGTLEVSKDDEDYIAALVTRMKEDEERARLEKGTNFNDMGGEDMRPRTSDSGNESPPKRQKTQHVDGSISFEHQSDGSNGIPKFPNNKPLRRPWPAAMTRALPGTIPGRSALSYFITIPKMRGKFLAQKAKALGVQFGPEFGKLANGQAVTTKEGRVVQPSECMESDRLVPGFAIIDIPDESFLEPSLESITNWKQNMAFEDEFADTCFWIWILGSEIEHDERLLKFIKSCEGKHVISSSSSATTDISLIGSTSQACRLNLISNDAFPLPCPDSALEPSYSETTSLKETTDGISRAQALYQFDILPSQKEFRDKILPPFSAKAVQIGAKDLGNGEFCRKANEAREIVEAEAQMYPPNENDFGEVEFIPLGTGSALPSKYRNVSSTLVRIPKVGNILLDCGENTLGQLLRAFGSAEVQRILEDLKCVYISHLHADHHLGTAAVLKAWYNHNVRDDFLSPELFVFAPAKYQNWLQEYAQIEDIGLSYLKFMPCESFLIQKRANEWIHEGFEVKSEHFHRKLSLVSVQTSYANHCMGSFTVAFTFKQPLGLKIAYSGDTRPTPGFVQIGTGATVLLHEATFDDELHGEAIAKKHSTTSEAIQAGVQMGAKNLLLTHFSQRYPKLPTIKKVDPDTSKILQDPIVEVDGRRDSSHVSSISDTEVITKNATGPVIEKSVKSDAMKIGFAFDLQRIRIKDFWKLEKHIPALQELFKDEEEEILENVVSLEEAGAKKEEETLKKKERKINKQKKKDTLWNSA